MIKITWNEAFRLAEVLRISIQDNEYRVGNAEAVDDRATAAALRDSNANDQKLLDDLQTKLENED